MPTNVRREGTSAQMSTQANHTSRPMADVMAETFERGDATSVGHAWGVPQQHVHEMIAHVRRNPFDNAVDAIRQLRRNGNEQADELFLAMARALGFVAYRPTTLHANEDAQFADVLREFADLVAARSDAERDGTITAEERARIATQAAELIERTARFRDSLTHVIDAPTIRRFA